MPELRIYDGYSEIASINLQAIPRARIQKLFRFELTDGSELFDTLYIQLEISKGEQDTSKEVIDRLANRDAPFTRMRIRRE